MGPVEQIRGTRQLASQSAAAALGRTPARPLCPACPHGHHMEERGLVRFEHVSVLNHTLPFGHRHEWDHLSASLKQKLDSKSAQQWAIKSWGRMWGGAPGEVGDGSRASGLREYILKSKGMRTQPRLENL